LQRAENLMEVDTNLIKSLNAKLYAVKYLDKKEEEAKNQIEIERMQKIEEVKKREKERSMKLESEKIHQA
jgi:phosphoribosylcarboxyaminoimidazole (NCAIR) mutase